MHASNVGACNLKLSCHPLAELYAAFVTLPGDCNAATIRAGAPSGRQRERLTLRVRENAASFAIRGLDCPLLLPSSCF